MRDALLPYLGQRLAVVGTVSRFGCRPRFCDLYEHTILLTDVQTRDGALHIGHLWLTVGARLAAIDPQPGDVLSFRATPRAYTKHKLIQRRRDGKYQYVRATTDYTLRYAAKIEKIATSERSACDGC